MKILISGHTKGIGYSIAEKFKANNYEINGYSRSTGGDLHNKYVIRDFINDAFTSDVIVLNADLQFNNVDILYQLYNKLKNNKDKSIIVVGSHSTETTKYWAHPYQIQKMALEEAARQLQNVADAPYIGIVRPGYVDTERVAKVEAAKIDPAHIADIVYQMVDARLNRKYNLLNILITPVT